MSDTQVKMSAADELVAAEADLERAKQLAAAPQTVLLRAQVRVDDAKEAVALEEVEAYAKSRMDKCETMLDSEALKWLERNAPIGVIVKIVNTYRYAEMLSNELEKQRAINKDISND